MAVGIISGGENLFRDSTSGAGTRSTRGVFADHPGATLKHAWNRGRRRSDKVESMARLFVELQPGELEKLVSTLPPDTKPLARVLANNGYVDFLMERAQESFREKTQIVDTLTDNWVAFYSGQEAPIFQYGGRVLNTFQDDQRVWLLLLYRDILRGSRLAHRNLIAHLRYDSFIVSGYLETLDLALTSDVQMAGQFNFSLRPKTMSIFTPNLSRPTVLQTAATNNTVFEGSVTSSDVTARTATIGPEEPPTAVEGPEASSEDTEIDAREAAEVSRRVVELQRQQQRESQTANLNNSSNDGQGGLSNVYGFVSAIGQAANLSIPRAIRPRIRGLPGSR